MKRMITAVAALLLSAATFAQQNESARPAGGNGNTEGRKQITPEQRAKRETDQINSLTPLGASYDKVLAVNTDYETKRQALRPTTPPKEQTQEQADAQRAKMRTEMKTLNDAHKKDLESAMGADLYTKYQAALKAKRDERKAQRQQGAPGEGPAPAGK